MNYKIILNEEKLNKFIDEVLPNLSNDETFYVSLFARSKYAQNEDDKKKLASKAQYKRFCANKKNLVSKLKQLETPYGTYEYKGFVVPQETLAVYITLNPRSIKNAMMKTMEKILDNIKKETYNKPPHVIGLDSIQISPSTKKFYNFDFDMDKTEFSVDAFSNIIKNETSLEKDDYFILETRGGYHLLVKNEVKEKNKKWYMEIQELFKKYSDDDHIDLDGIIPLPYCVQGGFEPNIYNF